VRQVGYLPELYEDARSGKYEIFQELSSEQKLLLPHGQNHISFRAAVLSGPHMAVYSSQRQYSLDMNFTHTFNPLNAELNSICHLLPLLGVHFLHVSRIRVKSLTLRLLMSYMYIWSTYS
jgi:UDP-N-acetylmuramyl pentapeptide synthase